MNVTALSRSVRFAAGMSVAAEGGGEGDRTVALASTGEGPVGGTARPRAVPDSPAPGRKDPVSGRSAVVGAQRG